MIRKALTCVVLLVLALGAGSAQAGTVGVLSGTGSSEFGECSQDSLDVVINGVEAGPDTWVFDVTVVNNEPTCGMFPAISIPFTGSWTPAGGCVPALIISEVVGPLNLCLNNPVQSGISTVYDFSVCENIPCGDPNNPDKVTVLIAEA